MKNIWIETTRNDGPRRLSRREGEFKIGKSIWAPKKDKGGQNAYSSMGMVKPGDVVIHILINKKLIIGTSLVVSKKPENIKGPSADYENIDCTAWKLDHFKNFLENGTSILIMDHMNKERDFDLLSRIKDTHNSFYASSRKNSSNNFDFKGKGYLFPASKELLTYLNRIYKSEHFNNMPHISSNLIYSSEIDLLELFENEEDRIKKDNKEIGGITSYEANHNNDVEYFESEFRKMKWDAIGALVSLKKFRGDVDLFLLHDKTIIIIEYKTTGKKNIRNAYNEWNGKKTRYLDYLYNEHEETKGRFNKVVYLFVVKNTGANDVTKEENYHRKRSTIEYDGGSAKINSKSDNKRITIDILTHRILHHKQFNYYFERAKTIDPQFAKRIIFSDFGINPENDNYMAVPAIELTIAHKGTPSYKVYNFSCSPKQLLQFASVSVRAPVKEDKTYYQRLLNSKRIKDIGEDFIDKDQGYFPNNIILKLNKDKQTFTSFKNSAYDSLSDEDKIKVESSTSETNDIGILKIKENYNSAWIIDGQHRLFSYMKSKNPEQEINNTVNVAALVGVNEDREAQYFLDINDNQTGVDADLIWDLNGTVRPQSDAGIISNACKYIYDYDDNYNIFYQNLSIPSRQKIGFKYSAFCGNLYTWCKIFKEKYDRYNPEKDNGFEKGIKNPFFDKDKEKMSKKIGIGFANFFVKLHENLGEKRFREIFMPVVKKKETRAENFVYIFTRIAENYFKHYRTNIILNNNFFNVLGEVIERIDSDLLKAYRQGTNNELRLDTLAEFNNQINRSIPGFAKVPESKLKKNLKMFMEQTFPEYVYKKIKKELGLNFVMHAESEKLDKSHINGLMKQLNMDITNSNKTLEQKQDILWTRLNFQADIFKNFIFTKNGIKIPKNHELDPKYLLQLKDNNCLNVWDSIFEEIFTQTENDVFTAKFQNKEALKNVVKMMSQYRGLSYAHQPAAELEARDTWNPKLRRKLETDFSILKDIIDRDMINL